MTTVSYAVYEVETGEVVHLHIESAALDTSPEEILAIADPGRAGNLAVVQVPAEGLPAAPPASWQASCARPRRPQDSARQARPAA